jgi:hypothetical protein
LGFARGCWSKKTVLIGLTSSMVYLRADKRVGTVGEIKRKTGSRQLCALEKGGKESVCLKGCLARFTFSFSSSSLSLSFRSPRLACGSAGGVVVRRMQFRCQDRGRAIEVGHEEQTWEGFVKKKR